MGSLIIIRLGIIPVNERWKRKMKLKGLIWVSSFATIFLFLPSLAFKLWEFLTQAPWAQKSWLVYSATGLVLLQVVGARLRFRKKIAGPRSPESLLFLAKQRLVKGELSLEEFRQIREEILKN